MKKHIVCVGAGAIGSYVGGLLAIAKEDVTLIDGWAEHVQAIKVAGLRLTGTQGQHSVMVNALHISEVQGLVKRPIDIAFMCVKSYDTAWATTLVKDYLSRNGFVVSLQNGINEMKIASIVGWPRTVGAIANTIGVNLLEPGHVSRDIQPGGSTQTVFYVGEPHGQDTSRSQEVVRLLGLVDSTELTTNLWGERWSKVVLNSMINPVAAISGFTLKETLTNNTSRGVAIRLGIEAVAVGQASGYQLGGIWGVPASEWKLAVDGSTPPALQEALIRVSSRTSSTALPSIAQDLAKGRRTEIDSFNGLVVQSGAEVLIATPISERVIALVKAIERGEIKPHSKNLQEFG